MSGVCICVRLLRVCLSLFLMCPARRDNPKFLKISRKTFSMTPCQSAAAADFLSARQSTSETSASAAVTAHKEKLSSFLLFLQSDRRNIINLEDTSSCGKMAIWPLRSSGLIWQRAVYCHRCRNATELHASIKKREKAISSVCLSRLFLTLGFGFDKN